ncbi:MAG: 50S ribosomal protein L24 [Planctomycetes bacterium]|nr:50S ribosomal protein L24 [Planctomycetota bacterium]
MAARIRRDDIVEVISGVHKGAHGKVLRVDPVKQRVVVEGVNMVYRHVRRSRQHPQGGRIQKEAPIHISNVMPIDPKTSRVTRVRFRVERDEAGKTVAKQRVSLAGTVLSEVTRGEKAPQREKH